MWCLMTKMDRRVGVWGHLAYREIATHITCCLLELTLMEHCDLTMKTNVHPYSLNLSQLPKCLDNPKYCPFPTHFKIYCYAWKWRNNMDTMNQIPPFYSFT